MLDEAVLPMLQPPSAWPGGCRFHPRCRFAAEVYLKDETILAKGAEKSNYFNCCFRIGEIEL